MHVSSGILCFGRGYACAPLKGVLTEYSASFLWIFLIRGFQLWNGNGRGKKVNLSKIDAYKLLPHVPEGAVQQQTTC